MVKSIIKDDITEMTTTTKKDRYQSSCYILSDPDSSSSSNFVFDPKNAGLSHGNNYTNSEHDEFPSPKLSSDEEEEPQRPPSTRNIISSIH